MFIKKIETRVAEYKREFDKTIKKKYEFKTKRPEYYENYQENEMMKRMNNRELLAYQDTLIKDQDVKLESILNDVQKGSQKARLVNEELIRQNDNLDVLAVNVDEAQEEIDKVKGKFEVYLENSSNCTIIVVIFVEIISVFSIAYLI